MFARREGFQNSQILGDYEHLGVGPPRTLTRRTAARVPWRAVIRMMARLGGCSGSKVLGLMWPEAQAYLRWDE